MIAKESENKEKNMPLDGIKVVEYGVFHAGPGGGAILGDLGAEVIKIETKDGDPERYWTRVAGLDMSAPNGESLMYEVSNRNKKCICLDIKTEKGREILHRLVKDSDVFLTNLRKSTKEKLGIDYPSLSKINPQIIHANVSGYGPEGPFSDVGGFDPMGQACSGLMFATGSEDPLILHLGILDQATAISLSHAVITALLVRERQGIAQEVHVSLYGTALWLQHPNLMLANALSVDPCVVEDRTRHSPLRNAFYCKDGKWVLGTHHPEEKYWPIFCRIMGKAELLKDSQFTDECGLPKTYVKLNEIFDKVFATKTQLEWMTLFLDHKMMFCPVQKIQEVKNDPQALQNNYILPYNYPGLGKVDIPGFPIHFSESQAGFQKQAPKNGEHTEEILKSLGFQKEEIVRLKAEKTVK